MKKYCQSFLPLCYLAKSLFQVTSQKVHSLQYYYYSYTAIKEENSVFLVLESGHPNFKRKLKAFHKSHDDHRDSRRSLLPSVRFYNNAGLSHPFVRGQTRVYHGRARS